MQPQADAREGPLATTKGLLHAVLARLDRQDEQLAAIGAKLHYLDSALDARLARALAPGLAAVEERLASRDPSSSLAGDAGYQPTRGIGLPSSAPATPRAAEGAAGPAGPPGRAALARTSTLKHSFLRRFVRPGEQEARRPKGPTRQVQRMWDRLLDSVFGICEADPKVGKEGSRAIHPQSHFVTGTPRESFTRTPALLSLPGTGAPYGRELRHSLALRHRHPL